MKFTLASLLFILAASAMGATYKVDPNGSKITYVGKKVIGEHTGTLTLKSGTIIVEGNKITGGEFVADMNSLTSTDITDKDYNAKYVTHMKSADFFNTEKFPEAKVVIKGSVPTEDKKALKVNAELTMLGTTKPISFVVDNLKTTETELTAGSKMVLDRTLWGLKYGSASYFKGLGDKAIKHEFDLAVEIKATK